ncbi:hypothetical protein D9613_009528 [Agrocybe pediades]|uniref:DNA mismatch repair protein MutL n=1 Tax=Agrocybe pediades TaxID=84607 RepID=A0A8H4R367_9AGAR|nr:hypothetical protein D9613_009528 [Agrocybe pediades]
MSRIKPIDSASVQNITSGQVVVDLQTAVKELLENSLDAGATNIDVRFRNYGVTSIEIVDNGSGIKEEDNGFIGLKHHTSKLETYDDLLRIESFGFRGEALSSLCATCEAVTICTATSTTAPVGVTFSLDKSGRPKEKITVARTPGTTVTLSNLFKPLPVRKKEFERNAKREFGKALTLLNAYALGPCSTPPGVRLTVTNQQDKGPKTVQFRTLGSSSRDSVTALWGTKALDNVVDMDLNFEVEKERSALKRLQNQDKEPIEVQVKGLISKFVFGCGRTSADRQFFYINGRPCHMPKVQKAFNEVYRSFNTNQSPFVVADFIIPTDSYDVNVSPDKRTILLHHEGNLISALKTALEAHFSPTRATFDLGGTQPISQKQKQQRLPEKVSATQSVPSSQPLPLFLDDDDTEELSQNVGSSNIQTSSPKQHSPDNAMEVDDEDVITAEKSIVLDTSQTKWGRQMGIRRPPSPPAGKEVIDDVSVDGEPPPKRRKPDTVATPSLKSGVSSRQNMRSKLSGFARAGSGVPSQMKITSFGTVSRRKVGIEEEEEEEVEEEEVAEESADELAEEVGDQDAEAQIEEEDVHDTDLLTEHGDQVFGDEAEETVEENTDIVDCTTEPLLDAPTAVASPPKSNLVELVSNGPSNPIDLTLDDDDILDSTSIMSLAQNSTPTTVAHADRVPHPEVIKTGKDSRDIALRFNLDRIKSVWLRKLAQRDQRSSENDQSDQSVPEDAGVANIVDNGKAADALARVIEKTDFETMDVVGQFNLGFVIVRRTKTRSDSGLDDLFIVDQHAADEKYNFETLQATAKIESQKLFRPRPLELTASDEMVALENLEILQRNGFELDVNENNPFGQGSRLKLTAQPVINNTSFDMKDLEELINLLHDRTGTEMVRCSKARSMFASRACRKSVMIGKPLNTHQMTTLIRHMGTMDQPWNCPHGRPTMRHLVDIRHSGSKAKESVDWSSIY